MASGSLQLDENFPNPQRRATRCAARCRHRGNYHDISRAAACRGFKIPLPSSWVRYRREVVASCHVHAWSRDRVVGRPVFRDGSARMIGETTTRPGRVSRCCRPAHREPQEVSLEDAARPAARVWQAYDAGDQGQLVRGRSPDLGASGGVGVAWCRSESSSAEILPAPARRKLARSRRSVADHVVDYSKEGWWMPSSASTQARSRARRVDVAVNFTGSDTWRDTSGP